MKVIVAGCRHIGFVTPVYEAIEASGFEITEHVSGGAGGADACGECWARENEIDTRIFRAKWGLHGRSAGPRRNRRMAEYADALIAVWDGKSRGTQNMIKEAKVRGLQVYVHRIDEEMNR